MLHVLGCITQQHDIGLVVLAALLCLFACTTAMAMIARGRASVGRLQGIWLLVGGLVAGCGIWGLHFVAMLAYRTGLPVAYDMGQTAFSIVIAVVLCGLGFRLALTPAGGAVGGALTGVAICAMHYIGMMALRMPATAHWDVSYVIASVAIGMLATTLALHIAFRRNNVQGYVIGAVLFFIGIVGMHFTGMSAVVYRPDPTIAVSGIVMDPDILAIAVAAIVALVMALGLIGAIVDQYLVTRASGEAERLHAHIAALEQAKRELERTSSDLQVALTAADEANRTKSQFLASMSHELRTPLNAVIGFSDIIMMEAYGPLGNSRYRDYLGDIRQSGAHLLSLINDILDLSRLDADECELREEEVVLSELIDAALGIAHAQGGAAHATVEVNADSDLPMIRADPRRIKQVLINLVSNSLKFTPPDGKIVVSAYRNDSEIAISVRDNGIGMAREDIPKAFERFRQIDSRLSRKYEGAGLGLPLSRQLMELHGGWLILDSDLNEGTTATMLFPLERICAEGPAPRLKLVSQNYR